MSQLPDTITVGDDVYETVNDEVRVAVMHLLTAKEKMGIPEDFHLVHDLDGVVLRYVLEIYRVWGALFPHEKQDFIENTKYELDVERPVKVAINAGGYVPVSFPTRFHNLIEILLPDVKMQDRRFWKPLFSHIPELKRSNYA